MAVALAVAGLVAGVFAVWMAISGGESNGAQVLALAGLAASFLFKAVELRIASMPD